MATLTKKRKAANSQVDSNKLYSLKEASDLVKKVSCTSFDASVDLHIRLNIDTTKPDQAIRGTSSLPNGTGKVKRVLVLCTSDKESEAKEAGADYVGLEEFIEKIEKGWCDIDVVIATPSVMPKIGKIGKILGPRNLMPNPKIGTVTNNLKKTVEEVKSGKIAFKADKAGIVHSSVGRVSFTQDKIEENASVLLKDIKDLRPVAVKGVYIKSVFITSTMSPSINIDLKTI